MSAHPGASGPELPTQGLSAGQRFGLGLTGVAVLLLVVPAPYFGWVPVIRLSAVLAGAVLLALVILKPWRRAGLVFRLGLWQPSPRVVLLAAAGVALFLFWYLLTRFYSGQINAIDFTIYYDRPCYQTVAGNPLFVEVSDSPGHSYRSELADHAYWAMLPICSVYAIRATPLWLHAVPALAVALGAVFILRILQFLGARGLVASAAALAFVSNDNVARALNYGFHPEILYMLFIPWMISAGLRGARRSFLVAVLGCVMLKESAFLAVFGATVAIGLHAARAMSRGERFLFLVLPNVIALANVGAYYGVVVPMLTGDARPAYAHFWGNYGDTPDLALLGMLRDPLRVLGDVVGSGIYKVLAPFLLVLPVVGWRFTVGALPIVMIFGSSANDQVRDFGIYYSIILVPFFTLGAATGALTLLDRWRSLGIARARLVVAALLLGGAVLVGGTHRGYSLRSWKPEIAALPGALAPFADEPVVLIQSGLFPHAGYDGRFKLLTPETLHDPVHADAVVVLARRISAYPFNAKTPGHDRHLAALFEAPSIRLMPPGLHAVRASALPVE